MAMGKTPFSAAASAIGYLYQCRYALLESLRRLGRDEQFMVSIELDFGHLGRERKASEQELERLPWKLHELRLSSRLTFPLCDHSQDSCGLQEGIP